MYEDQYHFQDYVDELLTDYLPKSDDYLDKYSNKYFIFTIKQTELFLHRWMNILFQKHV
jgi:hypothetical protein